jgi:hypothetical protein
MRKQRERSAQDDNRKVNGRFQPFWMTDSRAANLAFLNKRVWKETLPPDSLFPL